MNGSDRDSQAQSAQPKKLRFITNQGAPHPKRRRVSAACLTCRKRKIACSGERPTCQTCVQNHLDCAGFAAQAGLSKASIDTSSVQDSIVQSSGHYRKSGNTNDKAVTSENSSTLGSPHGKDDQVFSTEYQATQTDDREGTYEDIITNRTLQSSNARNETVFSRPRDRMPYFRWLGPTAIMPGFKQMVVKVKRHRSGAPSSTDENSQSPTLSGTVLGSRRPSSLYVTTPLAVESDVRTPFSLPFYDTSSMPPSELITHLCETFFDHLGCNFPFFQKDRFLKDLDSKQVDAMLVDAMCAMAARFSSHPLLVDQNTEHGKLLPFEYGSAFAQRAKVALPDTYSMPSVAAVQTALLLAYNEFGESRDSGLWMYLGISIRLAQDLGMQKVEGLRYEGRNGSTPRMVNKNRDDLRTNISKHHIRQFLADVSDDAEEIRAIERERIDTFWAVFFLDKVVSSGTGRRSTLRDDDIELCFPSLTEPTLSAGYPSPFPALIRIVHLYGRVADLLNSINEPSDITPETPKRLADMESQVTRFYQGLSPRLHFEAMNFHHYVKSGEGTIFVLLHFWFHTLIILLHHPTLLKTFEGKMLQLFPNSQQLSMSSAKTIADILSYSQLIDTKACLGNPFTTQPIYIAACAFLNETAERTATSADQSRSHSNSASRAVSPMRQSDPMTFQEMAPTSVMNIPAAEEKHSGTPTGLKINYEGTSERSLAKHSLLAKAASQHYQLCYGALQSIETYWAGSKYILTVLDQKFKGVGDPLLYTTEEGESSLEQPRPEPTFDSPGWRRRSLWPSALINRTPPNTGFHTSDTMISDSPKADHGQAIGWTLTGTLNSPNTNLAWHFPSTTTTVTAPTHSRKSSRKKSQPRSINQTDNKPAVQRSRYHPSSSTSGMSATMYPSYRANAAEIDHSISMPSNSQSSMAPPRNTQFPVNAEYQTTFSSTPDVPLDITSTDMSQFEDMLIESQDVDASLLGLDMMPWFDATGDLMLFDSTTPHSVGNVSDSPMQPQPGSHRPSR